MEYLSGRSGAGGSGESANGSGHAHDDGEWAEILARTVAHLAAQLTVAQLQLRALGQEIEARDLVDRAAVAARLRSLAETQTGPTLRENLGEALTEVVDVASLERELVEYLTSAQR